jgi:UDP-glucose 4-epimerase
MTEPFAHSEHIVVLGGAGFIGSHTVVRLLEGGHRVSILDNLSTGSLDNLSEVQKHPDLRLFEVELQDSLWSGMQQATEAHGPIDRIILLAAQIAVPHSVANPNYDARINYNTTWDVLEYARIHNVKKVVFSSSSAVYGDTEALPVVESVEKQPLSPYGINKYASEMALRYYWNVHNVPSACLRFFNAYGPRQNPRSGYSGVISIFIDRALAGKSLTIFGDGEQTRDFVYVGDVAHAILRACFGDVQDGSACNVSTNRAVTIRELAELIKKKAESNSEILYKDVRKGDILHSFASYQRAQELLGFEPETSLEVGLEHTVAWCKTLD